MGFFGGLLGSGPRLDDWQGYYAFGTNRLSAAAESATHIDVFSVPWWLVLGVIVSR